MSMREAIFFQKAPSSQRQSRNRVGSAGSVRSKGPSEQWQWTRPGLFVELATKQGRARPGSFCRAVNTACRTLTRDDPQAKRLNARDPAKIRKIKHRWPEIGLCGTFARIAQRSQQRSRSHSGAAVFFSTPLHSRDQHPLLRCSGPVTGTSKQRRLRAAESQRRQVGYKRPSRSPASPTALPESNSGAPNSCSLSLCLSWLSRPPDRCWIPQIICEVPFRRPSSAELRLGGIGRASLSAAPVSLSPRALRSLRRHGHHHVVNRWVGALAAARARARACVSDPALVTGSPNMARVPQAPSSRAASPLAAR